MADYVQELQEKLQASRNRLKQGNEMKNLKAGAPTLLEIIDGEISLAVNRMTQPTPLSYDEYLSAHGEVKGIKRIRDLINSKEAEAVQAQQEVAAIEEQLEQFSNDKKQQQTRG